MMSSPTHSPAKLALIRELLAKARPANARLLNIEPGQKIDGYVVTHTLDEFKPGHRTVTVTMVRR